MFELIEKLRQKPDRVKRQIAFLVAFFMSGLIFVIWLSVIYPDWRDGEIKKEKVSQMEPSPMSGFTQNFSNGFSSLKSQFSKVKETLVGFTAPAIYSNATTTSTTTAEMSQ